MSERKESNHDSPLLRRATNDSLRLLRYRMRSERELIDRLQRKGYTSDVITSVLARLRAWRYLDDATFTAWWTDQRLKTGRAYGRIRHELRQKGIPDAMIQHVFNTFRTLYDESDQAERLAQRRLSRWQGLARPVARRRLAGYLSRRGYSSETIGSVLQRLLQTT